MTKKNNTTQTTESRRKLLKTIVAGGGAATTASLLPAKWQRPIVDSIALPSHAQTSQLPGSPFGAFTSGPTQMASLDVTVDTIMADHDLSDELLDFFTPAASAVIPSLGCNASCDVEISAVITEGVVLAALCATSPDAKGPGSCQATLDNASSPSTFDGPCYMFSEMVIENGTFQDPNWEIAVRNTASNVVTNITLTPGGPGCP